MKKYIERLRPPKFAEPEKDRIAELLFVILIIIAATGNIAFPFVIVSGEVSLSVLIAEVAALNVGCFIMLKLIHNGRLHFASTLVVTLLWILITYDLFTFNGIKSPSVLAYFLVIILAGLLKGTKAVEIYSALIFLVLITLFIFEQQGLLTNIFIEQPLIVDLVVILFIFALGTALLRQPIRSLSQGYEKLQESELNLTQTIEKLQKTTVSKNYVDNIIQSMGDSLIVLNMRAEIENVNPALLALLGYREEELVGHSISNIVSHSDQSFWVNLTGSSKNYLEVDFLTKDGNSIPVRFSSSIMTDYLDREEGIVCVAQDISEEREAKALLMQAKQAAESTAQAKADFLANMSHEIRTPMNAVMGMATLLSDTSLNDEQQSFVDALRISGDSLLNILNDILDFSKIDAGKLEFANSPFHLQTCVQEVINLLRPKAEEKGLQLTDQFHHISDNIIGDEQRLKQILTNLIGNAIKFTEQGEVSIKVEVDQINGRQVKLKFTIRDTGIGIPKDGLKTLFQPFNQVDGSATRRYGGTGLGLSISRRLVQEMGGEIWVETEEGVGSTFYFTIATRFDAGSKSGQEESLPQGLFVQEKYPLQILLVEDNLVNQKVALAMLKRLGYEAEVAVNGLEALAKLEAQQFNLVLMDIQMPEMDGLTATKKICNNSEKYHAPFIVAMTANALQGDRERYLAAGMDDYVSKPIQIKELKRALKSCFLRTNQAMVSPKI